MELAVVTIIYIILGIIIAKLVRSVGSKIYNFFKTHR